MVPKDLHPHAVREYLISAKRAEVRALIRGLSEPLKEYIAGSIAKATAPLTQTISTQAERIAVLEEKLAIVEATKSEYVGIWDATREYRRSQETTLNGCRWICRVDRTTQRPGDHNDAWQLTQKVPR